MVVRITFIRIWNGRGEQPYEFFLHQNCTIIASYTGFPGKGAKLKSLKRCLSGLSPFAMALCAFMSLTLLSGCGGGSAESSSGSTSDVPATPSVVPLAVYGSTSGEVGQTLSYLVVGGSPAYSVISSISSVASISPVSASEGLHIFTATLNARGAVALIVTDASKKTVTTNLTVTAPSSGPGGATPTALYTTAPSNVSMLASAIASYTIAGGAAPYTATSSNVSVADAVVSSGSVLTVNSKALAGTADIVVKDTLGAQVTIGVTVSSGGSPFSTTAPLAITLSATGAAGQQTYTNSGGTAPYTCTSDTTSIATASCTGTSMVITGVADGKANVLVQDATGSASQMIAVNVATGTGFSVIGSADWTIPEAHCSFDASYVAYTPPVYSIFFINGGRPPYTVESNNPLIGTIIGTGTTTAPWTGPSGAASVSVASRSVQKDGYFVVAWPDADASAPKNGPDNLCASGSTSFKVIDSNGAIVSTPPTFKVTLKP